MKIFNHCDAWTPHVLSILRIMSALTLLQFGTAKILHFPYIEYFASVQMLSLPWIAGMIELVGGLILLLGFRTRFIAFILSGEMAFAYFIGHAPNGFFPIANQGTPAILFCFIFLYLAFAGGGRWSLDALCKKFCSKEQTCGTGCCKQ